MFTSFGEIWNVPCLRMLVTVTPGIVEAISLRGSPNIPLSSIKEFVSVCGVPVSVCKSVLFHSSVGTIIYVCGNMKSRLLKSETLFVLLCLFVLLFTFNVILMSLFITKLQFAWGFSYCNFITLYDCFWWNGSAIVYMCRLSNSNEDQILSFYYVVLQYYFEQDLHIRSMRENTIKWQKTQNFRRHIYVCQ